jgi:hypothetical protein
MARPRVIGGILIATGTGATGVLVSGDAEILHVDQIDATTSIDIATGATAYVNGNRFDPTTVAGGGTLESLPGDRAAWDTTQNPDQHARDIQEDTYTYHLGPGQQAQIHDPLTLASDADTLLGLTGQQLTLDTQAANLVFAGPATGAAADPTFRALVDADIPAAIARDSEVTSAISAHEGASDPHAGYLTPAEHTAIGNGSPHHAPVTLGVSSDPALALSGQELTLTLSSSRWEIVIDPSIAPPDPTYADFDDGGGGTYQDFVYAEF